MDMVVQSMNPSYSSSYQSKTAEIMSRYRPIAPKPSAAAAAADTAATPQSTFRSVWPKLHERPTRARKRARGANFSLSPSPTGFKRVARTTTSQLLPLFSPAKTPVIHGFTHRHHLPLLSLPACAEQNLMEFQSVEPSRKETLIDLNAAADEIPEERDLLRQLQEESHGNVNVIAPQPVRPIGSCISILCMEESSCEVGSPEKAIRKPEEVEEEVEMETLPAVISDSNNKVRLANSAYKEMVGQPECPWLGLGGGSGGACRRIAGEVMLRGVAGSPPAPTPNGFSCCVRIEWGTNEKTSSVDAFCHANRLSCESKDYVFAWRFHAHAKEEVCQSST